MTGRTRAFVFASLVSFCFSSCSESPIPRPKGYQRINIPEASFSQVDLDCGLSLEKPQYSSVELIKSEKVETLVGLTSNSMGLMRAFIALK